MLKTIVLVALFTASLHASVVHAHCQTVQKKAKPTGQDPDLHQLVIGITAVQQSLPGLTSAVNRLADATEKATQKPDDRAAADPAEEIDRGGWLTLLAILIALSAYMASLRWALIDKCGKEDRRQDLYKAQIASIDDSLSRESEPSKRAPLDADKKRSEERVTRSKADYQKHQVGIRWISLVDVLLVVAAVLIFLHLFAPYLWPFQWSILRVAIWAFGLAALVFIRLHFLEWKKAMRKMRREQQ